MTSDFCAVRSSNEWDPLEEVIVGRAEMCHVSGALERFAGAARAQLDELARLLEENGVVVRRPDVLDSKRPFRTHAWSSHGFCTAAPRDGALVMGDEIIEAPMGSRRRSFEMDAYRALFREYFEAGARWTAAPRPVLGEEHYDGHERLAVNDSEPLFAATDFIRCGADLLALHGHGTNPSGIEWLRRHLGDAYRIHTIATAGQGGAPLDTILMPIAPGKLLIDEGHIDIARLPSFFDGWDILIAPPTLRENDGGSINVLSLDGTRILVEQSRAPLIEALRRWSFAPIPCAFLDAAAFAGSLHGATLDVRRRSGTLQSPT